MLDLFLNTFRTIIYGTCISRIYTIRIYSAYRFQTLKVTILYNIM
jgi:hypothetical protein